VDVISPGNGRITLFKTFPFFLIFLLLTKNQNAMSKFSKTTPKAVTKTVNLAGGEATNNQQS